ncbi:Crp/Fnr family transcriptional regulator [Flavobacterium sp. NKUCC04_CG]|uniref:Crp/Fnr family transcriptional regulator n=1 Tax=Flavobacterium sp. NKUCC04_CG TaxID=2842121 RepID=UPI001C5AE364|nr:Crp/Fnr family transcriptional regulator [Flavobacterium sp. NKUCC04_CG]MBW3517859.1 Crp/Fnr family transcriptional regulator [Flavobacterium sp. NKUCC04_CG]
MNIAIKEAYGTVFEAELMEELMEVATIYDFEEGDILIEIGEYIKKMPLLLSGAIKIMREDKDEGELLLYFIEKGDTCAFTLKCTLGEKQSEIRAVAETSGSLALIPVNKMEEWMGKYRSWRNFVLNSYNNRLSEMLVAVDNLAFMKMDERLLTHLQEKAKINKNTIINHTHQEIAYELNTSRVVISRLLKRFEKEGLIRLNRKNIELLDSNLLN